MAKLYTIETTTVLDLCEDSAVKIIESTDAIMEQLGNLTLVGLADAGGAIKKARMKLDRLSKEVSDRIVDGVEWPEKHVAGDAYKATIVGSHSRWILDKARLIEEFSEEWVKEHSKESLVDPFARYYDA